MFIISNIKVCIKLLTVLLIVSVFLFTTSIINLIVRTERIRVSMCISITSFLSRAVLLILGVRVKTDKSKFSQPGNFLIISNHLSYLDTMIISSKIRAVFIASVDGYQEQFPLGLITKNSGGIFVERKSRTKVKNDLKKIITALELGFNVVLFPEGTTSDGSCVLPFKSSFFYASENPEIKILPVCINYKNINGLPIDYSNKNMIFFFEKIGFIKHFMRLFTLSDIEVSVDVERVVDRRDFKSRKELSNFVYQKISDLYEPKP